MGRKLGDAPRNQPQTTGLHQHLSQSDFMHQMARVHYFLTKNCGKELGSRSSLTPSRAESGHGLDIQYTKSRKASPTKPWPGTHRGKELYKLN